MSTVDRQSHPKERQAGLAEHERRAEERAKGHALVMRSEASSAVPEIDSEALTAAVERGAQGDPDDTASDVSAINASLEQKRTQQWNHNEQVRLQQRALRVKSRQQGPQWTQPELAALLHTQGPEAVLVQLDHRWPRQGANVLEQAGLWAQLVATLPAGVAMKRPAQLSLDRLVSDGILTLREAEQLFPKRFGHPTEGIQGKHPVAWNLNNVQVLWRTLARMPVEDVTLDTAIAAFRAIAGGGGVYSGSVDIGQNDNGDNEYMSHTVLHEVGHAVMAEINDQVEPWLKNDIGFQPIGFDQFIAALGGYPATFHDPTTNQNVAFDATWQSNILNLVTSFTGTSSWSPTRQAPDTGADAQTEAAWQAMPATVKNACAQSISQWYTNFENFQAMNGTRYFLNHWYHSAYKMGPNAIAGIIATNDRYTAMSENEFFANCYAEYFHDPRGAAHHQLWGGRLPASIKSFFSKVVLSRNPYNTWKGTQAQQQKNELPGRHA
jgi:hypothetical protein